MPGNLHFFNSLVIGFSKKEKEKEEYESWSDWFRGDQ